LVYVGDALLVYKMTCSAPILYTSNTGSLLYTSNTGTIHRQYIWSIIHWAPILYTSNTGSLLQRMCNRMDRSLGIPFATNSASLLQRMCHQKCDGHTLGCNNGIQGFHENLVTFKRTKLQDFLWAQKMRLKKCSS